MKGNFKQAFVYTTGWVKLPITVGGTIDKSLAILADAPFICNYITGQVRQAALLVTTWAGDIQISDSGRGRTLFNSAIPFDAIAGNARQPYPFDPPRLFRMNSTLLITFTTNVTTVGDIQISFHGNKIFPDASALAESEI